MHFDLTFSLMAPSFKGSCLKTTRETQYSGVPGSSRILPAAEVDQYRGEHSGE